MGECNGVTTNDGPFQLGSDIWPGTGKLNEEAGEVIQVIGKLIATGGSPYYWEGKDLRAMLEDEIADLMAAVTFTIHHNKLDKQKIAERSMRKLGLFEEWAVVKAG